jgi:predicted TIM-barrel fold metal-dependent hydrolase
MLGLRFYFNQPHEQSWPTDGTLDWLWPAAERAGVPIALAAASFLPVVGRVAERYPGLKLIVDHMGVPRATKGEASYQYQPQLLALAKHPNIAVKATGQAGYALDGYPFRSIHPHLRRVYDSFGPSRMFWGTDITRMQCSWRQCVTLFTEELPWLAGHDQELVMGRAFCDWIGWRVQAA